MAGVRPGVGLLRDVDCEGVCVFLLLLLLPLLLLGYVPFCLDRITKLKSRQCLASDTPHVTS